MDVFNFFSENTECGIRESNLYYPINKWGTLLSVSTSSGFPSADSQLERQRICNLIQSLYRKVHGVKFREVATKNMAVGKFSI
jgi:hypothetical protein